MFEEIGLLIATALFFAFATACGLILAGVTWLFTRRRQMPRKRLIVLALVLPVVCAAYSWWTVALLPSESLFGDINQPLPNGFILKALGKMPEYGIIERENGDLSSDGVHGDVDEVAVNGPFVAGRYCRSCDPAFVQSNALYFILDTRISKASEYNDLVSLNAAFHSSTQLVENQYFRSRETQYLRQQRLDEWVMFAPPLLLLIAFAFLVLAMRIRSNPSTPNQTLQPNIYT